MRKDMGDSGGEQDGKDGKDGRGLPSANQSWSSGYADPSRRSRPSRLPVLPMVTDDYSVIPALSSPHQSPYAYRRTHSRDVQ